jgi:hypothetical protein
MGMSTPSASIHIHSPQMKTTTMNFHSAFRTTPPMRVSGIPSWLKPLLPGVLSTILITTAPAAVVLSNFSGTIDTTSGVKGTGGAIPTPISYGFEFTVGAGDHDLTSISLDIGTHFGTVPLSVDLMSSPSGPATATFLTEMSGPLQPNNQIATYSPLTPVTLVDGATYFLRLTVNGSASQYGINRTGTAATGTWTMGDFYVRPGAGTWSPGGFSPETMVEIVASPIPEPSAAILGCAGLLILLRRRRG